VRLEDLIVLFMKIVVFSSVAPCTLVTVHQYVKEKNYCVRLYIGNLSDVKEMISTDSLTFWHPNFTFKF